MRLSDFGKEANKTEEGAVRDLANELNLGYEEAVFEKEVTNKETILKAISKYRKSLKTDNNSLAAVIISSHGTADTIRVMDGRICVNEVVA